MTCLIKLFIHSFLHIGEYESDSGAPYKLFIFSFVPIGEYQCDGGAAYRD